MVKATWLSIDGETKVSVLSFGKRGDRVSVRKTSPDGWELVAWLDENSLNRLSDYVDLAELDEIRDDYNWEDNASGFPNFKA